ncbi:MAG: rRNA maturation RNase YbeY [Acidobacteria bacterium]|nr:rRNA maturation RNase YbeY [Acidobacteriota bacterium]
MPAVFAADEQSAVAVDVAHLVRLAEGVLADEGVRGLCELALYFVDEPSIADLNEKFLGGEGPTDVLAFPIDDELTETGRSPDAGSAGPDRPPTEASEIPLLLGDVLVCPAVASRNAAEHGRTVEDELALLVVHGVLHVLGMDHATDEETAVMQARERELLERFHHQG